MLKGMLPGFIDLNAIKTDNTGCFVSRRIDEKSEQVAGIDRHRTFHNKSHWPHQFNIFLVLSENKINYSLNDIQPN
jgi:hypothetical protein